MSQYSTNTWHIPLSVMICAVLAVLGCSNQKQFVAEIPANDLRSVKPRVDSAVQLASYQQCGPTCGDSVSTDWGAVAPPPFNLDGDTSSISHWDLSVEETIQFALANSTVMREIGAHLLQNPELAATVYGPSVRATDPRFGEEAALSAFDSQLGTTLFYEKNDRALNNSLLGGGTNFFEQDLWRMQTEISKRAATGTRLAARHYLEDDLNNAPSNIYGPAGDLPGHAWTWNFELEARHPLFRQGGTEFNRLAGPNAVPGEIHGVLIARVNTTISAADFQLALRNYLSNVENAYWELLFAYRDLEAKKTARNRSLATWQRLKELNKVGISGAEEDKVAQAEEQYYRFQQDVENALAGRLLYGTRNFNGSTGGSFQGTGGVFVAERRLRLLIGAPLNDGRLIRPSTEPSQAEIVFDWESLVQTALTQRTELLQQQLRIRRRSMELCANRNFLLPQLDVVGRYRRRGFGDNLYDPKAPEETGGPSTNTGTDEWQVGVEFNVPLGYRQGHAAVRNAELALARERAVLDELQRQIIHDLGNTYSEQARLQRLVKTTTNRRSAALRQYRVLSDEIVRESARGRRIDFNLLLDSERRLADAEIAYHRASVERAVAVKNIHLEAESLLSYCNVHIADSRTP